MRLYAERRTLGPCTMQLACMEKSSTQKSGFSVIRASDRLMYSGHHFGIKKRLQDVPPVLAMENRWKQEIWAKFDKIRKKASKLPRMRKYGSVFRGIFVYCYLGLAVPCHVYAFPCCVWMHQRSDHQSPWHPC